MTADDEAAVLRDFADITAGAAPPAGVDSATDGARSFILGAADLARKTADQITTGPVSLAGMAAHVRAKETKG